MSSKLECKMEKRYAIPTYGKLINTVKEISVVVRGASVFVPKSIIRSWSYRKLYDTPQEAIAAALDRAESEDEFVDRDKKEIVENIAALKALAKKYKG